MLISIIILQAVVITILLVLDTRSIGAVTALFKICERESFKRNVDHKEILQHLEFIQQELHK